MSTAEEMDKVKTTRFAYKSDKHGNGINAKVCWSEESTNSPKAVALIYHGGGLIGGSAEIIPPIQIEWLVSNGLIVVTPNYRLVPQVPAKTSLTDCEEAYDWATGRLGDIMTSDHGIVIDSHRTVALGHSIGGTIALHLASTRPLKAVTAFHSTLYFSDPESSGRKPATKAPFTELPDYTPSVEDWELINPADHEVTEFSLAIPGTVPPPRNRWQLANVKNGLWAQALCPDGDFAAVDPLTRLNAQWPAVMLVQGGADTVPGSGPELVRRAEADMKAAGLRVVQFRVVEGAGHMFDLPSTIGTTDLGPKWEAVLEGLQFLKTYVQV